MPFCLQVPVQNTGFQIELGDVGLGLEHLSINHKSLGSIPSITHTHKLEMPNKLNQLPGDLRKMGKTKKELKFILLTGE